MEVNLRNLPISLIPAAPYLTSFKHTGAVMDDLSVARKRLPTVNIGLPKSVPSVNGSVSSFSSLQPLLPQRNLPVTRDPSKSSPHSQVAPFIKRGMARGISSFKPKIGTGDVSAVGDSIVLKPALKRQWSSADINSKKLLNQLSALSLGPAPIKTSNIGLYDGKLEMDLKQRVKNGEKKIIGEAGEILKLSSSQSKAGATREWKLNMFEMGQPLGKGKFGRVYMIRTKVEPKFILALKCMYKAEIVNNKTEIQIRREIEIQQNLRHPNVLRLYGFFHDESRVFLMLEYAGKGELYKQLLKLRRFSDNRGSRYIAQMADALNYLHSKHVMHRDIKPENLLVTLDGKLKIADFGWSVHAPGNRRLTFCGTLQYIPPEILNKQEYSTKIDVWALGVLAYEFLCGVPPFEDPSRRIDTKKLIVRGVYSIPSYVSADARDLIHKLLQKRPADRITLQEVLVHPWLTMHNSRLIESPDISRTATTAHHSRSQTATALTPNSAFSVTVV